MNFHPNLPLRFLTQSCNPPEYKPPSGVMNCDRNNTSSTPNEIPLLQIGQPIQGGRFSSVNFDALIFDNDVTVRNCFCMTGVGAGYLVTDRNSCVDIGEARDTNLLMDCIVLISVTIPC